MQHKKDITVAIDTSGIRVARVTLIDRSGKVLGTCVMEGRSQTILPTLEKALKDVGATVDDIGAITVNRGPGSFTGIRVGVAVAKTLSLLLGITINGTQSWEPVDILYEKDKYSDIPVKG